MPTLYGPVNSQHLNRGFVMVARPQPAAPRPSVRWPYGLLILGLLIGTNLVTYHLAGDRPGRIFEQAEAKGLYLIERAARYVSDTGTFELKVRDISAALNVPPEWLMAVMYNESRFDPAVKNRRGSGATGLIQFMVPAVKDLNVRLGTRYYMRDIQSMAAHDQLDLVYEYLQTVRERYGEFDSLTELYLAILYPRALDQDACYTLFSKPSRSYMQNIGLDENRDGSVTITDIDRRMRRLYPTAYHTDK